MTTRDTSGATAEDIFKVLDDEVSHFAECWGLWKSIWMNKDAIHTINAAGMRGFFVTVRDSLLLDISMTLARILDPPQQQKGQNIVLNRLIEMTSLQTSHEWKQEIQEAYQWLTNDLREMIHGIRHKRLAHNDYEVITTQGLQVQYRFRDDHLDTAIENLRIVLQAAHNLIKPGVSIGSYLDNAKFGASDGRKMIDILNQQQPPAPP